MRSVIVVVAVAALTMTQVAVASDAPTVPQTQATPTLEDAKCKRTTFKTALVKSACAKGLKEAVKAMKTFTKKAKAATGEKINCKSCHSGLKKDGYPLKPNGLELFKKYDAAIKGSKIRPSLSTQQHAHIEAWIR